MIQAKSITRESERATRVHEERVWMNGLSLTSARAIESAARAGYVNDLSTYVRLEKDPSADGYTSPAPAVKY